MDVKKGNTFRVFESKGAKFPSPFPAKPYVGQSFVSLLFLGITSLNPFEMLRLLKISFQYLRSLILVY